jgi:hypothetical protein
LRVGLKDGDAGTRIALLELGACLISG